MEVNLNICLCWLPGSSLLGCCIAGQAFAFLAGEAPIVNTWACGPHPLSVTQRYDCIQAEGRGPRPGLCHPWHYAVLNIKDRYLRYLRLCLWAETYPLISIRRPTNAGADLGPSCLWL